jgi:pyruvate, water dikinase
MSTSETFLYHISHSLDDNTPGIGGKARNILRLAKIPGICIPKSCVLTASALYRFVMENFKQDELRILVENFLNGERSALLTRMAHTAFPADIEEAIINAVPENDLVIIRSSGTLEDSASKSLAGHYESLITRTDRKDILFTIKTCWLVGLRVFMDQLLDRSVEKTIDDIIYESMNSIALVIQEVIDAEKSGIYFSQSPIHPGCALAVANWGTCHSCVDGRMISDFYIFKGTNLESFVGRHKFEMTTFHRENNTLLPGEIITTPLGKTSIHFPYGEFLYSAKVPFPQNKSLVLNEDEIAQILETVTQVKSGVGYEIDCEWSFVGDKLYMLQVRPITTEPPKHMTLDVNCKYVVASRGIATGAVKIVLSPRDLKKVAEGDIIVVMVTDPDFMPIIYKCSGIISEEGSPLSHTAIVARELKIPCILGVRNATKGKFIEGETITVDANRGRIFRDEIEEEIEESPVIFVDNEIIYDINHLKILKNLEVPRIAISAILYGFYHETIWEEPEVIALQQYIERLKSRYGLKKVEIYWDINDNGNERIEIDPVLSDLWNFAQKEVL